jgi:O-antigen ligase
MSRIVFWLLLATVLLSPIPFGAILPWSYTLLALIVGALVLVWSTTLLVAGSPPPVTLRMIALPAMLFAGVIVWAVIQASTLTPESWHNPIWAETAKGLGTEVQGYISVVPYATETSVMRLLTYAGIFWLALQFGRSGERARQVFTAVAIAGLFYAAYGLFVDLTGSQTILWYEKEAYKTNLTSTFRYKNAYASYAGMGLICTTALLVRVLAREDFTRMGPRERRRSVLLLIFERSTYLLLAFILVTSALLLSDSRGGFLAAIVAMIVFAAVLWRGRAVKLPYGRSGVGVMIGTGLLFIAISGGTVMDRLGESVGDDQRARIYAQTMDAIAEHPLKGWGLGSFESVFAKYQDDRFEKRTIRAHNEYLDNALGLGIPAATVLVLAIALLALRCLRGSMTRQRDSYYPAAGFAISVFIGIHSLVDFTMQVPAVAATFALLLGVCCAQSWSSLVRRIARTGT